MKFWAINSRNTKELLRDSLTLLLGIAVPLVMLAIFITINNSENIPELEIFKLKNITPGIIIFGYSFLMMFSGLLITRDKKSSFLTRLFASPLRASDYIGGYVVPLIPIAIFQAVACYLVANFFGLSMNINILYSFLILLPSALFAISTGVIFGSLLNEGQVAGFGSIYITITQLFSGAWMDVEAIGGPIKAISDILPFSHMINAVRETIEGNFSALSPDIYWILTYTIVAFVLVVFSFKFVMKR